MINRIKKVKQEQIKTWIKKNRNTWQIICGLKEAGAEDMENAINIIRNTDFQELKIITAAMDTAGIIDINNTTNSN